MNYIIFLLPMIIVLFCRERLNSDQKRIKLIPKKTILQSSQPLRTKTKQLQLKEKYRPRNVKRENSSENFKFALAFQESGDMDVLERQLLEGAMFCIEKVFQVGPDTKNQALFIGNFTRELGDDVAADLKKFTTGARAILGVTGMDFLLQIYSDPILNNKLYLFPIDGVAAIRLKQSKNTIFYRPTYKQELKVLVDYIVDVCKKERISVLYESGAWGNALYEDLLEILKKRGIKPLIAARYQQNTVEVARALKSISNSIPDVVFCLAKPRPAYYFIKKAMDLGMYRSLFVGISPLLSIQALLKESRGVDLITTSVVPPESSNLELITEYKKLLGEKLTFKHGNHFYLEAFLYVQLFKAALNDIPGIFERPELLIEYFESFKEKNFFGLPLSFNPVTRGLSTKMWIATGAENPWIEVSFDQK